MTDPTRDQLPPSRAAWAVPLGLGIGGLVAAVLVISVGVGYDVVGRSPPPLVLVGLSLLIGPQFLLARLNYPGGARVQDAAPAEPRLRPISESIQPATVEAIRMIDEAITAHGSLRVAQVIREALAQLPASERVLQLPSGRRRDAE
jgi:hypothetical protein